MYLQSANDTKNSFTLLLIVVVLSGGWAVGCCQHGIVYAIKNLLRSESPRDYVDMERSLRHRPSITICDIAHLVANMGNKIKSDFFGPNEGRLCEDTSENVENATLGKLQVSIEFLTEPDSEFCDDDPNTNPVTGSKYHLALFDWFHQFNCKKAVETLRKCSLVPEIAGIINTQVVEQVFSEYKKDLYFMNNYSPANHMFLFRLLCHLRNEKKNAIQVKKQSTCFDGNICLNQYGQICQQFMTDGGVQTELLELALKGDDNSETEEDLYEEVPVCEPSQSTTVAKDCQTFLHSETIPERTATRMVSTDSLFIQMLMNERHSLFQNTNIQDNDLNLLYGLFLATYDGRETMTETEFHNFTRNCEYARSVLFCQSDTSRHKHVQARQTALGLHYTQGPTNYCGVCSINNALLSV